MVCVFCCAFLCAYRFKQRLLCVVCDVLRDVVWFGVAVLFVCLCVVFIV